MAAFEFMVGRFADVMQQSTATCQIAVHAEHLGQQTGNESDLDTVPQHVLAVRGAKVQTAEHLNHSVV